MDMIKTFLREVKKTVSSMSESIPNMAVKIVLLKFFLDRGGYFDVHASIADIFEDFTFDKMVSIWAGSEVHILDENPVRLAMIDCNRIVSFLNDERFDISEENETLLGEVYTTSLPSIQRKKLGITYTPEEIREYMTGIVRSNIQLADRLIDPACGCGWFLLSFYHALINRYYEEGEGLSITQIHKTILTENIWGLDTSPESVAIAGLSLSLLNKEYVQCPNIACGDALLNRPKTWRAFDWVLTNPPYVGHKKMDKASRKAIIAKYSDVFYDKSDLSYCFFKLGYELLRDDGHFLIITSRYFMQSQFASTLRSFILTRYRINLIIDFFGYRPFLNAGIDPAIFYAEKGTSANNLFTVVKPTSKSYNVLTNNAESEHIVVNQDELTPLRFSFNNDKQKDILAAIESKCDHTLSDVMISFQGIITGCDRAFVVSEKNADNLPAIAECGVRWIKGKAVRSGMDLDGRYLLYVDDMTAPRDIPKTITRLYDYKTLLKNRREVRRGTRKWYALQWGRNRSLFEQPKIIYPYKNDVNCFVYDEQNCFFSADIYAMIPSKGFPVIQEKLAWLLSSRLYDDYFKSYAKKLGGALYEYYPNTVLQMKIPAASVINSFETEGDIYEYFGLPAPEPDMNRRAAVHPYH